MTGTASAGDTLVRLRTQLAREGEAIAPVLSTREGAAVVGPLVRSCTTDPEAAAELALVFESILEGYLLHYGRARLVETADVDLRLLAGDHMYALGLCRLARLGDLDAVRAMAELISLCARAHVDAGADGGGGERCAPLWLLTALSAGAGGWPGYEGALATVREGRARTAELLDEARRRAAQIGVELEAEAALIAFQQAVSDRPHA